MEAKDDPIQPLLDAGSANKEQMQQGQSENPATLDEVKCDAENVAKAATVGNSEIETTQEAAVAVESDVEMEASRSGQDNLQSGASSSASSSHVDPVASENNAIASPADAETSDQIATTSSVDAKDVKNDGPDPGASSFSVNADSGPVASSASAQDPVLDSTTKGEASSVQVQNGDPATSATATDLSGASEDVVMAVPEKPQRMISLRSSNGRIFRVPFDVVRLSGTVMTLLENFGLKDAAPEEEDNDPIPLPLVRGEVLQKVLEWATHHKDDPLALTEEEDTEYRSDNIVEWDKAWLDPDVVEQSLIFELIAASNYLEVKALLILCYKTVANMIKKAKTPENIRILFHLENDFTPEEEEAARKENTWNPYGVYARPPSPPPFTFPGFSSSLESAPPGGIAEFSGDAPSSSGGAGSSASQ